MKQSLSRVKQPKQFDFILMTILILTFLASVIAIYASFPLLPAYLSGSLQLGKQIMFYIFGIIIILAIIYIGNENLFDFAKLGYKIVLILLLYLFIDMILMKVTGRVSNLLPFASAVNGADSWFEFPLIGTLQPSEFMKVILIIITAYIIKEHNENKTVDTFESDLQLFIKVAKWAIAPLLLILAQPDTGIFIIIIFSLALMLACSGIRKEWIIGVALIVGVALFIFFYLYYFDQTLFAKIFSGGGYKTNRIYGWLNPEENLKGPGLQLYTALISIGSSGLFGHGLGSTVISSIPEAHTDFIFAVIGLNFGLIGCLIVVILCVALDVRLCIIASRSNNHVEKMMIIGFVGMLIFQQIQNIGMVLGLLPITGITLPLISSGGSSLLSYMIAFGIIFNASAKAKKLSDFVYD